MAFWKWFLGFIFRPMLYTAVSDQMVARWFERGAIRVARATSISEDKITEKILKAAEDGKMKEILNLEPKILKDIAKRIKKINLCIYRQLVLQFHLGSEINAALMALKETKTHLDQVGRSEWQSAIRSIDNGIGHLENLKKQLVALMDNEIGKIDRMTKQGNVYVGVKMLPEGEAYNEELGLLIYEGRNVKKTRKVLKQILIDHVRALAKSATARDSKKLEEDIKAFETFINKDLKLMNALFYDDLTLLNYTKKDKDEMEAFFKKLGLQGFPETFVAKVLNEINALTVEEVTELKRIETASRWGESQVLRGVKT